MIRTRILVVEDDESVQERYRWFFDKTQSSLFDWSLVETGRKALGMLQRKSFDLVVLDIRLPDMSGLDILRWREKESAAALIPVLVVSGEAATQDRVAGLNVGADDYIVKPFSDEELLARLLALKRRRDRLFMGHGRYDLGWLKFDSESHQVAVDGALLHMEPKEMELLIHFLRRPRVVHQSRKLWDMFWDEENPNFERILANKISSLRRRLGRGGACLVSRKGIGYSFDPSLTSTETETPT